MDATFAAVIAGLLAVGLYRAFRLLPDSLAPGRPADPYPVGQEATVLEIDNAVSERWYLGRVRIQGETWRARLSTPVPRVGETARVIGGEGATLFCTAGDAPPLHGVVTTGRLADLVLDEVGRTVAAVLGAVLASISLLAISVAPIAAGMAVFGFFAPFAAVLALIAIGSPSRGPGCTVRGLRAVVAATFGLATFQGLTFGLTAALAPGCAGLVLMALDPALGAYLALLVLLCLSPGAAVAVESVPIPSQDGKLQLPGYWFETSVTEPRPAVISLHGCGGLLDDKGRLSRNRFRVAEYLNVEKIHMLAVDSFTPRGERSICETPNRQRSIQHEDRRADVFAAMQWLASRPTVDKGRIAVVGYSNGGGAVLSLLDRTDKAVQGQTIQPKAAIAFYPPCTRYLQMWNYELSAPLLLMIGALDDWTPPQHCVDLHAKVKRAQPGAEFELIVYPESHHGFDGLGSLTIRTGLPTRSGWATVGGNPEAREQSLRQMFDFLAAKLDSPLRLSHDERFKGHRFVVPAATGFARIEDVAAVPLDDKHRARYQQYLALRVPKAFAITERGGSYFSSDDAEAMQTTMERCQKAKVKCWLYAVDDRVVWSRDDSARIDLPKLLRKTP
jgi:dienelactone hydrolase